MTNTNPRSPDQNSSPDPDKTFVGPMNGESAADQTAASDSAMSAADQTFVPVQQGSNAEHGDGHVADTTFVPPQKDSNGPSAAIDSTIIPPTPDSSDDQNELAADSTFVMPKAALPQSSPDDSDDAEATQVRPRSTNESPRQNASEELNADATAVFSRSIGNRPPDDDPHEQETLERGTQSPKTRANIEGRTIGPKGPGRSSQIWNIAGKGGLDSVISLRKRPVSGSGAGPFSPSDDADFEVVQKLAEGGMGVVYVARQKSLNRELAIKTLKVQGRSGQATRAQSGPTQLTRADRQKREMFLSEALVTANLVHPNIIPIHELAETNDGVPYYVMKRVHGIPWNKRLREMSLAQNLEVLHKVCDAMAYAHHHGVINRDLKPENIMLGEFGEVLVLDWGLAVPAPHAVDRNFRSPAASFGAGTPAYMAPELWTGPETAIGETSDIYLLGAILFEIITHLPPHEFPSMPARGTNIDMMRVIDGVLRDNRIRSTSESGELMDIAMKAMRTDPEKRFGSVLEFQFAVRNFQRHEESRRLSNRAGELLESKDASREYHTYQTAAALFEESLRTWKNNGPARNGLRTTRLRYAKLASSKGDFDLGLQIASQENDTEFLALQRHLVTSKRLRASVKWAAVAAMVCVILLGVKAIYDNGIITNLNAEVETRQKEAAALIAKADEAREAATAAEEEAIIATRSAQKAKEQAQLAINDADTAKKTADAAKMEAAASAILAATEKQNAEKAQALAAQATAQAMTAQKEASAAKTEAETANRQVAMAQTQLADAEQKTREALTQQEKAETAARVAQVEIQSQLIRGHTLSQNYADALREVDQLLKGDLLHQLPETIQNQRRSELEAQREQLLRRTRQSDAPVQSQVISPDGTLLVTGDRNGLVEIFDNPARTLEWGSKPTRQHQFASEIYRMRFGQNRLFVAVGPDVFVWDLKTDTPQKVVSHQSPIRGLDVDARYLISGDTSGIILIHDAQTMKLMASLAALTQLQDVAIIPGTSDFLYAGSRGGQSADILAYRIPFDETETTDKAAAQGPSADLRPRRLGQLRMTRGQNEPPAALSVSPDGSFLAISNQTNGDLLVLPRTQTAGSDSFPFLHPVDLEQAGRTQWKLSKHARPINDLRWSSDSQHLLTASDDRSIGVWDRSTDGTSLKFRKEVRGHGARVLQCLFLNREATRFASSSADLQSRLWDLSTLDSDTRQLRQVFHLSAVEPKERRAARPLRHVGYLPVALPLTGVDEQPKAGQSDNRSRVATATRPSTPSTPTITRESRSLETVSTAGPVRAVRFDASGSQLLGGTSDGTLVLWNAVTGERLVSASGQEILREGHEFHIAQMAVAGADRNILITAGYDGTLRLWDLGTSGRTGIQKQVLSGIGLVNAFATSADGRWLATTFSSSATAAEADDPGAPISEQFGCHVWNIEELLKQSRPQPRMSLSGVHKSELTSLSFSPNGQYLATGGRDGVLAIWDLATNQLLTQTRAHRRNTIISSLNWLNDQHIVSAGMDGQLLTWSLTIAAERNPVAELTRDVTFERDQTPIERVSVSPDRAQMLVISVDTDRKKRLTKSAVELRSTSDSSIRKPLTLAIVEDRTPTQVTSAQWSSNGQQVLLATNTGIQEVSAPEWKVKRVFSAGTAVSDAQFVSRTVPAMPQAPDSCILTFDGNTARLWSNENRKQIASFRGPFPIRDVALTSGSSPLAVSAGLTLRIFDGRVSEGQGGKPLFRIPEEQGVEVTCIAPDHQGSARLAFADSSGVVRLGDWDAATNTLMVRWSLKVAESPVAALRWTPKSDLLAVVSVLGEIVLVNTEGIATVRTTLPDSQSCRIISADIDSTGHFLAIAGERVSTSESIGWILSDLMNEQGQQKEDTDAPVAEQSAKVVCQFSGHSAGGITTVHFVPSSPYLISGGHDGAIIIWNWQSPLPGSVPVAYEAYRFLSETQPAAHAAPVTSLDVSDTQLASAGEDGKVILWKLPESITAVRAAPNFRQNMGDGR